MRKCIVPTVAAALAAATMGTVMLGLPSGANLDPQEIDMSALAAWDVTGVDVSPNSDLEDLDTAIVISGSSLIGHRMHSRSYSRGIELDANLVCRQRIERGRA